ncbi:MAG: thiol-disulfide isomerase-like thioredoxin [Schlesneria sp.]|nr:thiol-disulfide isomerase-like thioredoxin [Schlesneria sp.]
MSGRLSCLSLCLLATTLSGCVKQPTPVAPTPVVSQVAKPAPAEMAIAASNPAADVEKNADSEMITERTDKPAIPAEPKAIAKSPKEMLKLAGKGVVIVTVYDALGEKVGFGSGCILDKGSILTNFHVVSAAASAKVQPRGTKNELLGAPIDVIGYRVLDERNDLAILAVDGLPDHLHTFKLAPPDQIEQYDRVFAIGHPNGLKFSTSTGIVSGILKTSDMPEQTVGLLKNPEGEWIQTDAVIAGGSSGGPLLNEEGDIVGINTLRFGPRTGLAVAVRHVSDLLSNLSESSSPLPVPNANVLATREVAEIKRGFDLELNQFVRDVERARIAEDSIQVEELLRKNDPAPECVVRCLEIVRKHRGERQAEDAIRLCVLVLATSTGETSSGREYVDELFDEAALDPKLIPPSMRVIYSLQPMQYSDSVAHYLRSVLKSDIKSEVKATAGVVLVSIMAVSGNPGLEAETMELAKSVRDESGMEHFQGSSVIEILNPIIDGRNFEVGSLAAEIEGKDADGKEFKLSEYRGNVVVLDFWADWCPHCRNMYPHERELVERLKDKPFVLLGINGDEPARAERAIAAGNVTWRSWLDGPTGPIGALYQLSAWPTIYVLDKEGRIRFKDVRGEELEAAVDSLLEDSDVPFLSANDIVATNAEWKYRPATASDNLANWQQAEFDDSAWVTGPAPFGYHEERTKLEQREPGQRPLTTVFRRTFDSPTGKLPAALLMKLRYHDGIAVTLNGTEVYRDRLTATAGIDSPALSRAAVHEATGVTITVDSSLLKPTGNCIAVELHQFSAYSAHPLFELTLGSAPDLVATMATATEAQKAEVVHLLRQAIGLPGAAEILEKLQTDESPDLQVRAAVAAAMNGFPVKLETITDEESLRSLVKELFDLNQLAWDDVSRDDLGRTQYARGLQKGRAGYTLLPLADPQFKKWVDGLVNIYGVALYRNGQYEKAQEILKESVAAKGDNPVDFAYLSMVLQRLGKTDEAAAQREQTVKLLNSDIWKHDAKGHKVKMEVNRVFSN